MTRAEKISLLAIPIVILIGGLLAWAGSQGSASRFGLPLYAWGILLAFLLQWIAFVPAYQRQTEKFYDLTGSLTYLSVTLLALLLSPAIDLRASLLALLIVIWAVRLGSFLYQRVHKAGADSRFDEIKRSGPRFLLAWSLQGLWVSFSLAAALAAITSTERIPFDFWAGLGLLVWLVGFAVEVMADQQKSQFRADPQNKGEFIRSGLWAWSRHPNYFGEIVLWVGIALIALPVLRGWQYVTLISPLFVIFLLTRVSGIPILEARADEKWGNRPDYQQYKATTPVLIPKPPR
ncbi:MAG: DUF1295 domain-containing protein [Anaerolineales bacterium]|nr:DUF1295 domain-containing protein [Anaerolineales bacterium]